MTTIRYEFDDDDGINPTGESGIFTFDVECSHIYGCAARIHYDENDHPGEPDEVEVLSVELVDDGILRWNDSIKRSVENWFLKYIESDKTTYGRIYEHVCSEVKDERDYYLEEKYERERNEC